MRAIVIHNLYRSVNASGENHSVRDEIAGLRRLGWEVEVLSSDSDIISGGHLREINIGVRPLYSRSSVNRVREMVDRFQPHVALVENVFPLISPWVIRTLNELGIPVAAGIRSYRNWCVASTHFRDGKECFDCLGSVANGPAVRHGCYQNSAVKSVPMAASLRFHRSTWPMIDRFLPVSEHVAEYLRTVGVPADKIVVRPNFVGDPGVATEPGHGFAYAGRLTEDKGVGLLLDAWKASGLAATSRLVVAGTGPMLDDLQRVADAMSIEVRGLLSIDDVRAMLAETACVVMPSTWSEPFGRGVIEAAALGRPAVVTNRGGLPSLVVDGTTGWITEPDAESMAAALQRASAPDAAAVCGAAARTRYEEHYTEAASLAVLNGVLADIAR